MFFFKRKYEKRLRKSTTATNFTAISWSDCVLFSKFLYFRSFTTKSRPRAGSRYTNKYHARNTYRQRRVTLSKSKKVFLLLTTASWSLTNYLYFFNKEIGLYEQRNIAFYICIFQSLNKPSFYKPHDCLCEIKISMNGNFTVGSFQITLLVFIITRYLGYEFTAWHLFRH